MPPLPSRPCTRSRPPFVSSVAVLSLTRKKLQSGDLFEDRSTGSTSRRVGKTTTARPSGNAADDDKPDARSFSCHALYDSHRRRV